METKKVIERYAELIKEEPLSTLAEVAARAKRYLQVMVSLSLSVFTKSTLMRNS